MPRMPKKVSHLVIRLARYGCVNRPFYHIVVMPNRANRNAYPVEQLGTYDPMPNLHQEKLVSLNFERIRYWIASGAQTSKPMDVLLGLAGFFPVHPMTKIAAERKRKQAAKEGEEKAAAEATEKEAAVSS